MTTEALAGKVLEAINANTMNAAAKVAYIREMCKEAITEANREKTCNKSELKRIRTIEKFLDKAGKDTRYRFDFGKIKIEDGAAYYSNGCVLAILQAGTVENIKKEYLVSERDEYMTMGQINRVIPSLSNPARCELTYGELTAFKKVHSKEKKNNDYWYTFAAKFSDNTTRYFNVEMLLHACEVLGLDKMVLLAEAGKGKENHSVIVKGTFGKMVVAPMNKKAVEKAA